MTEKIEAWLRVRDGARFQQDMKGAAKSIRNLANEGQKVSAAGRMVQSSWQSASDLLASTWKWAKRVGVGIGIAGVAAAKFGLSFNATMEQNQIAFTYFLGSAEKAKAYMKDLFDLAAQTPFEFTNLASAAKQMIAFGFSAGEAYENLKSIGNAVSALGTGQEGINRIVLALGQMKAAGVVQGDELRQFQEAGINVYKYLEKAGLITKADIGQIGDMHLDATKAISAIMAGMNKDFEGMTDVQAKSWKGLISTIRDYAGQTLGVITMPLFNLGRKRVLPAVRDLLSEVTAIFQMPMPLDWKIERSQAAIKRRLGPLWEDLMKWWKTNKVNEKLGKAFEDVMSYLANKAAAAAPHVVELFIRGWLAAGAWGKLIVIGFLLKKMGAFKIAGDIVGSWFSTHFSTKAGQEIPAELNGKKGAMGGKLKGFGRWMGRTIGVAAAAMIAKMVWDEAMGNLGSQIESAGNGMRAEDRDSDVGFVRGKVKDVGSWEKKMGLKPGQLLNAMGITRSNKELAWLYRAGDPSLTATAKKQAKDYLLDHPGKVKVKGLPAMATGGWVQSSGFSMVGARDDELAYLAKGSRVQSMKGAKIRTPSAGGTQPISMEGILNGGKGRDIVLKVNGREIARATAEDTDDQLARR